MNLSVNRFFLALALAASILISPASASFHLWDIREVYSNAAGDVQFIELFTTSNSQQFIIGKTISSNANTFPFPTDSPSPTANRSLLLATPGFASLTGGVTPDYTIPANFFDPAGDTIDFAGVDSVAFSPLPTDGLNSFNYPGGTPALNTPENFAGDVGSLVPEPSSLTLGFFALVGWMFKGSRKHQRTTA